LLPPIYGLNRPAKVLTAPSFDLDKHKRVSIAADDIDFAATPAAEIAVENFITATAQKTARKFFA